MSKFVESLKNAMEHETNGTPFWNPAVANMAQEDRDAILAFQQMYVSPGGYQRVHQVNYDREDITDQVYFGGTNKADANEPAAKKADEADANEPAAKKAVSNEPAAKKAAANEPVAKKAAANEPVAKKADKAAIEEPDILNPDDKEDDSDDDYSDDDDAEEEWEEKVFKILDASYIGDK